MVTILNYIDLQGAIDRFFNDGWIVVNILDGI